METLNQFEDLDQEMSEFLIEVLGEPVNWRPMISPRSVTAPRNVYTKGSSRPDPTRPIVMGLDAIVTWRASIVGPGATDPMSGTQRAALESFDVAVDVLVSDFPNGLPQEGDIFEFAEPYENNQYGIVARELSDMTARAVFFCLGASEDDVNL